MCKSPGPEWLSAVAHLVQALSVIVVGLLVSHSLGRDEIEAQRLNFISTIIKEVVEDESSDPLALLPLVSSFDSTAVPHLVGLLESQAEKIEVLVLEVGPQARLMRTESSRWPLPRNLLTSDCKDPVYSEDEAIAYARQLIQSSRNSEEVRGKASELHRAWKIWEAGAGSLRSISDAAVDYLLDEIEKESSRVRVERLLRVLAELLSALEAETRTVSVLQGLIMSDRLDGEGRGLAVSILNVAAGSKEISVPDNASLDLACRSLKDITIRGVRREGLGQGALNLARGELERVRLERLHHRDVHLWNTVFVDSHLDKVEWRLHVHESTDTNQRTVSFLGGEIRESQFTGPFFQPNLTNVSVLNSHFENSIINDAVAEEAVFSDVTFTAVSFRDPTMIKTGWHGVRLVDSSITNGSLELITVTEGDSKRSSMIDVKFNGNPEFSFPSQGIPDWMQPICDSQQVDCSPKS